jgi:hypothetical protein
MLDWSDLYHSLRVVSGTIFAGPLLSPSVPFFIDVAVAYGALKKNILVLVLLLFLSLCCCRCAVIAVALAAVAMLLSLWLSLLLLCGYRCGSHCCRSLGIAVWPEQNGFVGAKRSLFGRVVRVGDCLPVCFISFDSSYALYLLSKHDSSPSSCTSESCYLGSSAAPLYM